MLARVAMLALSVDHVARIAPVRTDGPGESGVATALLRHQNRSNHDFHIPRHRRRYLCGEGRLDRRRPARARAIVAAVTGVAAAAAMVGTEAFGLVECSRRCRPFAASGRTE